MEQVFLINENADFRARLLYIHVPIAWQFFTNFYISWSTGMILWCRFAALVLDTWNLVTLFPPVGRLMVVICK